MEPITEINPPDIVKHLEPGAGSNIVPEKVANQERITKTVAGTLEITHLSVKALIFSEQFCSITTIFENNNFSSS